MASLVYIGLNVFFGDLKKKTSYLEEGVGFDGVCICKAAAEPLGYLPLQQLPENQKDVQKQKPFLRSEVYFIEIQNGRREIFT